MTPSQMLANAISIAALGHNGQTDKGGKPYILHTLKVMYLLKSEDYELMAIAVLHDIVEDQNISYVYLREQGMSERIIEGIRIMTKQPGQTQEEYLQLLLTSEDAMRVKLSDLRHNSDFRRLKGTTQKDNDRLLKYATMHYTIEQKLNQLTKLPK
jgi:(p)ppGpp synthase/HD superfamily hydrolase